MFLKIHDETKKSSDVLKKNQENALGKNLKKKTHSLSLHTKPYNKWEHFPFRPPI